jgi:hypothetical protein
MKLDEKEINKFIDDMPDEVLNKIQFSMPWQSASSLEDEGYDLDGDGAPIDIKGKQSFDISKAQDEIWLKFYENPQLNTSIRGQVGRLTGKEFSCASEIFEINEVLKEITYDWRNRLYDNWPKYVGHSIFNCELLLLLTVHLDGFVEVDYIDSKYVNTSEIIYHPTKSNFPLFYTVTKKDKLLEEKRYIPSIYIAKYPDLLSVIKKSEKYKAGDDKLSKPTKNVAKYKEIGGYNQFIVQWNRGFGIKRSIISHLVTIIKWINHYENLKQYEIDHKKSSGAYLWVFTITDAKAFKIWLKLSDDERKKTGITAKKTPGGSLILPPGIEVKVVNPQLPKISEGDTDILEMVSSGLNEPGDVMTGSAKGTYATVKASRAPMTDRTSDEIASFERFLKYDFWHSILFLRSKIKKDFKFEYKIDDVVGFKKKSKDVIEPIIKKVIKKAYELVDINFPVSQTIDLEGIAKGMLGVKHGPISETLGIPNKEVSKRLGINSYGRMRQKHALEKEKYPELLYGVDAETLQEKVEGEPSKKKTEKVAKKE